jgi:hypothetical protein
VAADLSNFTDQFSSKELFDAFKVQLAKDFEQSNFPTEFIGGLAPEYDGILEQISLELQRSESRADAHIQPLLYRIDISEAQLKKYVSKSSTENHFQVLAELIIKRILQKVVLRLYYKKNDDARTKE